MFGLIKNSIKTKIGIVLPASYPASRVTHESVSVTADGVKTFGGLLTDLYSAMNTAKITHYSKIVFDYGGGKEVFFPMVLTSAVFIFTNITQNGETINIQLRSGGASVFSDTGYNTSSVATSGFKITLYYD